MVTRRAVRQAMNQKIDLRVTHGYMESGRHVAVGPDCGPDAGLAPVARTGFGS